MADAKKKILIVEDDLALAQVYKSRLELEGFMVQHAPDGEKALTAAVEFKPDLILLDIMMPKINGFDALDILRNTPQLKDVYVIILTALSQQKDMERAQSLGADEYLVKSQVVIGDVVARVKRSLGA
ncbi:response regulator [Candidatus Saccharibacteria bacterium]|nr:response regulator [Candidatus Saccharibacteria bacterium]